MLRISLFLGTLYKHLLPSAGVLFSSQAASQERIQHTPRARTSSISGARSHLLMGRGNAAPPNSLVAAGPCEPHVRLWRPHLLLLASQGAIDHTSLPPTKLLSLGEDAAPRQVPAPPPSPQPSLAVATGGETPVQRTAALRQEGTFSTIAAITLASILTGSRGTGTDSLLSGLPKASPPPSCPRGQSIQEACAEQVDPSALSRHRQTVLPCGQTAPKQKPARSESNQSARCTDSELCLAR